MSLTQNLSAGAPVKAPTPAPAIAPAKAPAPGPGGALAGAPAPSGAAIATGGGGQILRAFPQISLCPGACQATYRPACCKATWLQEASVEHV